jgi:hypothetical protein
MSLLSHVQSASMMQDNRGVAAVSGSPDLVGPLDNERTMEEKLKGVRFMLDSNSGNIVAVPSNGGQHIQGRLSWVHRERDHDQEGGIELDDSSKSLLLSETIAEGYNDPVEHNKHDGIP